jgi:exodeoxyribonuclease V alpha subunit
MNPAGERKRWTFAPGDKVMQVENDYDNEGYLQRRHWAS